jgi:hypothetical protein
MNSISGIFGGIKVGLTWFLIFSPLIIGLIVILIMAKYKHRIILRSKTKGDTDIIYEDKWRIIKKKGQEEFIKLLKKRIELPLPPSDSLDMTNKGKYFLEGYISEDDQITWINVESKPGKIKIVTEVSSPKPPFSLKSSMKKAAYKILGDKEKLAQPEPIKVTESHDEAIINDIKLRQLTSNDKAFYFNRMRENKDKSGKGGIWQFLNQYAGAIMVIMRGFIPTTPGHAVNAAVPSCTGSEARFSGQQKYLHPRLLHPLELPASSGSPLTKPRACSWT